MDKLLLFLRKGGVAAISTDRLTIVCSRSCYWVGTLRHGAKRRTLRRACWQAAGELGSECAYVTDATAGIAAKDFCWRYS
jgi:hypothetical protein